MQKYLRELKPDQFGDLIAMNALYRPGPIEYIPNFIARKHGKEPIVYDLDEMKVDLEGTYGITVYQEQVMLLSQKIAGFSKGDADVLRKAMGKKDKATLDKMKGKFLDGAIAKGHESKKLEKIWTDWEAFAQYAFNKSHSTCYALVAYQTAYLKTHYAGEYMAAVLTNVLGNIEKITFFMEECKRMGIKVLGPDVNESIRSFGVNKEGQIRFGLGGIKGSGDAAVESIIEERTKNGEYKSIFDFVKRVSLRTVNKKTIESLAYAGAFDCFKELGRSVYFESTDGSSFIEKLIRYANKITEDKNSNQSSLFGMMGGGNETDMSQPKIPRVEPWGRIEELKLEKEYVGIYISGHPLDDYKVEFDRFCTTNIEEFLTKKNQEVSFGGIVTAVQERISKNGNPFCFFKIEDLKGNAEIALFGNDYVNFNKYIGPDRFIFIKGKVQAKWGGNTDQFELKIV